MVPTEGRVARPERRWCCRRGTPCKPIDPWCWVYRQRTPQAT